jgi:hypothetical protein
MEFKAKWGVWDEPWTPMFNKLESMCEDLDYYIYDLFSEIEKFGLLALLSTKKAIEIQHVLQEIKYLNSEIEWQKENNSSSVLESYYLYALEYNYKLCRGYYNSIKYFWMKAL